MLRANSSDSIAATPESVVRRILLCSRDIVFVFACLAKVNFYGTCAAARESIHLEWGAVSETHCQKVHQVAAATRKTPLIVVPSHYLNAVCSCRVREASTIEEFEFPRKSAETSSSSLSASMPFIGPSSAFRKAALTLSAAVGFSVRTVRSTTLT